MKAYDISVKNSTLTCKKGRRLEVLKKSMWHLMSLLRVMHQIQMWSTFDLKEMKEIVRDLKRAIKDVNYKPPTTKRRQQLLDFLSQIGHYTASQGTLHSCFLQLEVINFLRFTKVGTLCRNPLWLGSVLWMVTKRPVLTKALRWVSSASTNGP